MQLFDILTSLTHKIKIMAQIKTSKKEFEKCS